MPDRTLIKSCNDYGKEIVGVKHIEPKAAKGGFMRYSYTDEYIFKKEVVKKAVMLLSCDNDGGTSLSVLL